MLAVQYSQSVTSSFIEILPQKNKVGDMAELVESFVGMTKVVGSQHIKPDMAERVVQVCNFSTLRQDDKRIRNSSKVILSLRSRRPYLPK